MRFPSGDVANGETSCCTKGLVKTRRLFEIREQCGSAGEQRSCRAHWDTSMIARKLFAIAGWSTCRLTLRGSSDGAMFAAKGKL
jgi:hypothetical protein